MHRLSLRLHWGKTMRLRYNSGCFVRCGKVISGDIRELRNVCKLTTRQCTPQDLARVSTLFKGRKTLVAHELRQLTCRTPTTRDIDSVRVLPSTNDVVCKASAGSIRDGVVVVRTYHTRAALDHVCRSVHGLRVQRPGIGKESPLGVLVAVAVVNEIRIQQIWDRGTVLTSIGQTRCSQQRFVCQCK